MKPLTERNPIGDPDSPPHATTWDTDIQVNVSSPPSLDAAPDEPLVDGPTTQVLEGETLAGVAMRCDVDLRKLTRWNMLQRDQVWCLGIYQS